MRLIHKLFILLSSLTLLAALAVAGALAWNLSRGFSEYLAARDAEMLEDFVSTLEDSLYERARSDGSAPDPQTVKIAIEMLAQDGLIPEFPRRFASERSQLSEPLTSQGPEQARQGRPPGGFGSRLRVIDAQGRSLFGPPPAPASIDAMSMSRTITVNGELVGTARLLPRGPVPESTDQIFLRNQYVGGAIVTSALLALAGLIAWSLARAGVRMANAFGQVTSELAKGNFDARIPVSGSDEFAAMARDINVMAQSLKQLQGARRRWLAEISHELRTPLTVLNGELELLESGIRPIDKQAIHSLTEEALKLNRLIDDLHVLAVSDLGIMSIHKEECDPFELMHKVAQRHEPAFRQAGLAFEQEIEMLAAVVANWDSQRITQLVDNLMSNAVRYTRSPGQVRMRVSATGDHVQLIVEDSAPGVPADQYALLFEPLHRQEEARDKVSGGSGLGLSVAQAIVKAHGGTISAGPSKLGGLSVTVKLPLDTSLA